jgi:hypothetical protein
MKTLTAEEFKNKYGEKSVSKFTPVENKPSFLEQTGSAIASVPKNIMQSFDEGIQKSGTGLEQIIKNDPTTGSASELGRGVLNLGAGLLETAFSPVTGALKSTAKLPGVDDALGLYEKGVIKGTDFISDMESVQKFAIDNPNAEEIFSNAMTILTSLYGGKKAPLAAKEVVGGSDAVVGGIKNAVDTVASKASDIKNSTLRMVDGKNIKNTIESFGTKVTEPEVSDAVKVSLNPERALSGTGQDLQVSVNGKLKKLSELTPEESARIQESTSKSLKTFEKQAELFSKDRSVKGGSPVEMVGERVDKALQFADKKRQMIGQKMGDIESSFSQTQVPISEKVYGSFTESIKSFDNPKFGVDTADAAIVRKLIKDFDALQGGGASIAERLEFIRSWDKYLNDSKDAFGKFKENATVNTRIQNAVRQLKDETVDFIANKDKTYKNLRTQYRVYKQLQEIGDGLLGKDGALGQRIKGSSTVKRAIQSNSDAGARQFLTKLKELTGYDAIKEGDLALTAMEMVGDYQGLSLLNIVKQGKTGLMEKGVKYLVDKAVGDNPARIKKYVKVKAKKVN